MWARVWILDRGHGFRLGVRLDFCGSDADSQVYRRVLATQECSPHAVEEQR